jgi:biotin-(acetyl-CoA carboxylase) ligase
LLRSWIAEIDGALRMWQSPENAAHPGIGDEWAVEAWQAFDANRGRRVRIASAADEDAAEVVEGVDIGITPAGALRLRLDSGEIREILAGDCLSDSTTS